jgi:glutathione S-transferase
MTGGEFMGKPIEFYYAPNSRASTALWMLEECGASYETHVLDLKAGDQKKPSYLAINPMGKVPAIVHEGVVVTEVAAICAYLADIFPDAKLAPPVTDPRRGAYLRWLFFAPSCIEPAILDRAYTRAPAPSSTAGYGDFDTVIRVTAEALRAGPYLLGDWFTAADVVMGSLLRWTMLFKLVPELAEFTSYTARLQERPAFLRAQQIGEGLASASAA